MDVPDSRTAHSLMLVFHQYSLSIEHWRSVAEERSSAATQLEQRVVSLEKENRELASIHAAQAKAIEDYQRFITCLECDLQCQQQDLATQQDTSLQTCAPIRPRTPYPHGTFVSFHPGLVTSEPDDSSSAGETDSGLCSKRELEGGADEEAVKRHCTRLT